jgi:hypothetical protein
VSPVIARERKRSKTMLNLPMILDSTNRVWRTPSPVGSKEDGGSSLLSQIPQPISPTIALLKNRRCWISPGSKCMNADDDEFKPIGLDACDIDNNNFKQTPFLLPPVLIPQLPNISTRTDNSNFSPPSLDSDFDDWLGTSLGESLPIFDPVECRWIFPRKKKKEKKENESFIYGRSYDYGDEEIEMCAEKKRERMFVDVEDVEKKKKNDDGDGGMGYGDEGDEEEEEQDEDEIVFDDDGAEIQERYVGSSDYVIDKKQIQFFRKSEKYYMGDNKKEKNYNTRYGISDMMVCYCY